jgi:multiple sugar transport system substrate-binding protein
LAPPVGNTQMANLYQEFAKGTFAVYVSGPWNIGEFGRRLPAALQPHWNSAAAGFRQDSAERADRGFGSERRWHLAGRRRQPGAQPHLAPARSRLEAAGISGRTRTASAVLQLTGDLPARQSAWNDPALTGNRYAQAFRQQLQQVQATPPIPEWERIANRIAYYAELAVRRELSGGCGAGGAGSGCGSDSGKTALAAGAGLTP